jgi:hypothetical protein
VGGLAIPTAHKRNAKGVTQYCQTNSVEMDRRKLKGQPDLPLEEKASMNDGKHNGKTKAKKNAENPERSLRKSGREVKQQICSFATAIFELRYSEVDDQSSLPNVIARERRNNSLR